MGAVLQSLPMLGTVLLAMLFVLWCFAILGLQLFMGALLPAGGAAAAAAACAVAFCIWVRVCMGCKPLLSPKPTAHTRVAAGPPALPPFPTLSRADALHNNCFVLGADDQPLPFPPSGDGNYSTGYTPPQNAGQMCSTLSGSLWGGTE